MRKRSFLAILLTLCLVLSVMPAAVSAAGRAARDTVADGYYLIGTHNDWNVANLTGDMLFRQSLGNSDEFLLETTLTEGQEFKVVKVENGAAAAWYPDQGSNYVVTAANAGPAAIYFRPSYWNDWASNGGFYWVSPMGPVTYVDENGAEQTCTNYTTASFAGETWTGWIVVNEDTTVPGRIYASGETHLILVDGKKLNAQYGIEVSELDSLTIYGQTAQSGILNAGDPTIVTQLGERNYAGIGGNNHLNSGVLTINGGVVNAYGADGAAGIGGGFFASGGTITINAGTVNAYGGDSGDGIGDAESATDPSVITINGGTVNAYGGPSSAGIGVNEEGSVTINGGTVYAIGGDDTGANGSYGGAGIGADPTVSNIGNVTITGGTVTAIGQDNGAGIGCTSDMGYFGKITITGGVVNATGSGFSPAIGTAGGLNFTVDEPCVGEIVITGGQITAVAEEADYAIGGVSPDWYWDDPLYATITLAWTEETDFILSDGYAGPVTLTKAFVNAADASDIFEAAEYLDSSALGGKKLVPYVAPAPHEHNVVSVPEVPATCTEDGVKAYFYCDVEGCPLEGKKFADADLTEELTDLVLPATGHAYGAPAYEWIETDTGFDCTAKAVCANDATHVETETVTATYAVTTEPAVGVAGVGTWTATFTNELFETQTKTVEIPALESNLIEVYFIDKDDNAEIWVYAYKGDVHNADWPGEQLTVVEQAVCDAETSPNFHNYYMVELDANKYDTVIFNNGSGGQGNETRHLSFATDAAGNGYVIYYATQMGVNDPAEDLWPVSTKVHVDPTCTVDGSDTYTGLKTGATQVIAIPALGHLPGVPVQENYVEPSYGEDGGYDTVVYCQRCGLELSREHTVLPALQEDILMEDLRFVSVSLTIGEEILPTYTFRGSAVSQYARTTVEMTMKDGGEVIVIEQADMESLYNGSALIAKFNNIKAKEMWKEFSVRIVCYDENGLRYVGPADEHSVRSFLLEMLNKNDVTYNPKGKRLAADMLNYGAAAQLAFGENVEHLVNKDEDGNDIEILEYFDTDELPPADQDISMDGEGVNLYVSAALLNRVELTVTGIFTGDAPVYLWVKNPNTGVEYGPIETELAGSNPSTNRYSWRGYFNGVGGKNMRTLMEITMRDADGNVLSKTTHWSVEAFVKQSRTSTSTSQVMKDLLNAMLAYGDSAAEYLNP